MATEYPKLLSNITASLYKDVLKPRGFNKKGNTFNRVTSDGLIQVINFQAGRYEPWEEVNRLHGSFTVNLGIYIPEVAETSFEKKDFVNEYSCEIRTRLSRLSGNGEAWMSLKDFKEEDRLNLVQMLEQFGFPFLERFETREKIIKNIDETKKNVVTPRPLVLLALIHCKQGNAVKASELLKKQYDESSDHRGHQEYLIKLADKMGIKIS